MRTIASAALAPFPRCPTRVPDWQPNVFSICSHTLPVRGRSTCFSRGSSISAGEIRAWRRGMLWSKSWCGWTGARWRTKCLPRPSRASLGISRLSCTPRHLGLKRWRARHGVSAQAGHPRAHEQAGAGIRARKIRMATESTSLGKASADFNQAMNRQTQASMTKKIAKQLAAMPSSGTEGGVAPRMTTLQRGRRSSLLGQTSGRPRRRRMLRRLILTRRRPASVRMPAEGHWPMAVGRPLLLRCPPAMEGDSVQPLMLPPIVLAVVPRLESHDCLKWLGRPRFCGGQ